MDCAFQNETLTYWLTNYGSIVLFILLALGIIALPIPEETLMVFAGMLMRSGNLVVPWTILAAFAGSICGITLSYLIGRTGGSCLLHKYGSWAGITEKRIDRAKDWFEHFGKWTLTFGYFIPGVRHFTGLSAGMIGLDFRQFSLFAYSGAVLWITTFLSIGYFFGGLCFTFLERLDSGLVFFVIAVFFLIVILVVAKHFITRRLDKQG